MAIGTKAISKSLLKRPLQIIQIIAEQILVRAIAWSPIWVAFIFPKLSNTIPYYSVKTGFII